MRLGLIVKDRTRCCLCGWEEQYPDLERAKKEIFLHLHLLHHRVLMSTEQHSGVVTYHGVGWQNDLVG